MAVDVDEKNKRRDRHVHIHFHYLVARSKTRNLFPRTVKAPQTRNVMRH